MFRKGFVGLTGGNIRYRNKQDYAQNSSVSVHHEKKIAERRAEIDRS